MSFIGTYKVELDRPAETPAVVVNLRDMSVEEFMRFDDEMDEIYEVNDQSKYMMAAIEIIKRYLVNPNGLDFMKEIAPHEINLILGRIRKRAILGTDDLGKSESQQGYQQGESVNDAKKDA